MTSPGQCREVKEQLFSYKAVLIITNVEVLQMLHLKVTKPSLKWKSQTRSIKSV